MRKIFHSVATYGKPLQCSLQTILAILASLVICAISAADIADIQLWEGDKKTRLVVDKSKSVSHEVFLLKNPPRLVLDLATLDHSQSLDAIKSNSQIVRRVRFGIPDPGIFRVVLDLSGDAKFTVADPISLTNHYHRLFIDISIDDTRPSLSVVGRDHGIQAKKHYVVVLDPGHGGKDPGAVGETGIHEKDIVFEISKILATALSAEGGIKVVLTRSNDNYIKLRDRLELAKKVSGDVFISIHADAFHNRSVFGASVYSLSESGATTEMAAYIAKRENSSDLAGGVDLSQRDVLLAETMLDMQLDWKLAESNKLGISVLRELDAVGKLHSRTVEKAGFVVLKAPAIPSILVEVGYITNASDARRLREKETQHKIAAAILRGIIRYCHATPECPLKKYRETFYTVRQGDSLSKIASRLGSETYLIKRWNGLTKTIIHPQQKLIVPIVPR
ncbi:MAG: N-acetylmuramoyl-L-alanine amidase [Acidiferrobacteraceae bacterium]|nr:N-acetylmuramoyl-L-alanine amidase [Acidiferrobacteraceae bacterium]